LLAQTNQDILDSQMSEHEHQARLIQEVRAHQEQYPLLKLLFAIPNGGLRHPSVAKALAAEGVLAGVPDLWLPVAAIERDIPWPIASRLMNALAIEMKIVGNTPTKAQVSFHRLLRENGVRVEVCYSWHAAWNVICDYLDLPENARA